MTVTNTTGSTGVPSQRNGARKPSPQYREREPSPRRRVLVATTETLHGYEIRHILGEVLGVVPRPRNPYVEGVKALSGRRVDLEAPATALMRGRQDAIARMTQQAWERGANAVIGLRFDHRDINATWAEICAYGTAVVVERAYETGPVLSVASWPR